MELPSENSKEALSQNGVFAGAEGEYFAGDPLPSNCPIHYIKNAQYRNVLSTGVHGGSGPKRFVVINFFSERLPIPQIEMIKLDKDSVSDQVVASISHKRVRYGKIGIIREVEVGVSIPFEDFESVVEWMIQRRDEVRKILASESQKK